MAWTHSEYSSAYMMQASHQAGKPSPVSDASGESVTAAVSVTRLTEAASTPGWSSNRCRTAAEHPPHIISRTSRRTTLGAPRTDASSPATSETLPAILAACSDHSLPLVPRCCDTAACVLCRRQKGTLSWYAGIAATYLGSRDVHLSAKQDRGSLWHCGRLGEQLAKDSLDAASR